MTPESGLGKAWYLKDKATGQTWSAFIGPVHDQRDEYEVDFMPGRVKVHSLANKIACTLTIATVPGAPCEIWHVRLENRSAQHRSIAFTTYAEPRIGAPVETTYIEKRKSLLMRRALGSFPEIASGSSAAGEGSCSRDLIVFHSSTLTPMRYQTDRTRFVGEGDSLREPIHIENEDSTSADGATQSPVASLTVEVDVPLEGEAEFGFCFGVAESAEAGRRAGR